MGQLIDRVSSWPKLLRILAYVLKFIRRNRRKSNTATLTFEEIHEARILYLRHAQDEFQADYKRLLNQQDLRHKSKLRTLSPQIDKHGLLQVGGRLGNSELPADVQHTIILPKSHRITKLILEHEHRINLHPGVSALFVIARQRYWVFGARNLIRKIKHDCLKCFKQRQHTSHQFMSDLPCVRVRHAFPIANTGCDYAGPITLNVHKGRNPRKEKGYICLFVYQATSALHLNPCIALHWLQILQPTHSWRHSDDSSLAAENARKCIATTANHHRGKKGIKQNENSSEVRRTQQHCTEGPGRRRN